MQFLCKLDNTQKNYHNKLKQHINSLIFNAFPTSLKRLIFNAFKYLNDAGGWVLSKG